MGETEAGKFIPNFVKGLHDYISQGNQLTLQAVILGSPFEAGVLQRLQSYKPARALSLIDESNAD